MFRDWHFVFGSNLAGRHGFGAALHAREFCGARPGQAEGPMGQSYGIPTKDEDLNTLSLDAIRGHVDRFLEYAAKRSDRRFQVTRIGCGLAGYRDEDIAPMFRGRPENVGLSGRWMRKLGELEKPRLVVAGSRGIDDAEVVGAACEHWVSMHQAWPTVIHGAARGVDDAARRWANGHGMKPLAFPAEWERWRGVGRTKVAGPLRNQAMAWYGTHLLAIWDGRSRWTQSMVESARTMGLEVEVVRHEVAGEGAPRSRCAVDAPDGVNAVPPGKGAPT